MSTPALTVASVTAGLRDDREFGRPVRVMPIAVNVESLALQWARQDAGPEGALVVADHELSARVRRGIPWVSVAGHQLACSVVVRPQLPPDGEGLLWLLASVAAAEGVGAASGLSVRLKWPNDLMVAERRLGGVRVDAQLGPGTVEVAVLTVRVNVDVPPAAFPVALREQVTTVRAEDGAGDRVALLGAMLDRLEARYREPVPVLLDAYRERCDTIGRHVHARLLPSGDAFGTARDVSPTGALLIDTPAGRGGVSVDRLARLEHR